MLRRLLFCVLAVLVNSTAFAQSRLFTEASQAVRWQPWGEAALARAKKENKPLFVSSGFVSANAWHLMQKGAFAGQESAQTLNAEYVPVLVDQHLHPEVGEVFDGLLRTMTGVGGMPVNVILTPDLEPFAAAGSLSSAELKTFLFTNIQRWTRERDAVRAEGQAVLAKARRSAGVSAPRAMDATVLGAVIENVGSTWDSKRGGFGREPKFTQPMTVSFLLAYSQQKRHAELRAAAIDTLRTIAASPVHDQLGGGFHRGSVKGDWSLPFFEKTLYDQALLAIAFLDAWKLTRDPRFAEIAKTTLDYALRELRPAGDRGAALFWAAQDAYNLIPGGGRPELANGAYYVWEQAPVAHMFRAKADPVLRYFGITAEGNITRDADAWLAGKNLLWLRDPELIAKHPEMAEVIDKMRIWRHGRPNPFRDDTVLAGWNGLMISALARTGAALHDDKYLLAATRAGNAITTSLWNAKTKTLSRAKGIPATAEDYALLVQGLLDLFEATYDVRWYELALTLQARQDELFRDERSGRYTNGTSLPPALRGLLIENDVDTPGANGVAAMNLLRIANLTADPRWRQRAEMIFHAFGPALTTNGASLPQLAAAFTASQATPRTIVVIPGNSSEHSVALLRASHEAYVPAGATIRLPSKGPLRDRMNAMIPIVKDLQGDPEQATVYVCANGRCEKPTAEPEAVKKLLE